MNLNVSNGLARKVMVSILLSVAAFSIFVMATGWIINQKMVEISSEVALQLESQKKLMEVSDDFEILVSNFRAYMAYGRDEFAQELVAERTEFQGHMENLDTDFLSQGRTDLLSVIEDIQNRWASYTLLIDKALTYKLEGDEAAYEALSVNESTPLKNAISSDFETATGLQDKLLTELVQQNESLSKWMLTVPFLVLVGASVMCFILVRYLTLSVFRPMTQLSVSLQQVGEGRFRELHEHTLRNDELGMLYRGFNQMSAEIQQRQSEQLRTHSELTEQRDLLEAQNEEIMMQQDEQEETLHKLTARESELELIRGYQENLTGFTELGPFLEHAVPALLSALKFDAAMIVLEEKQTDQRVYRVMYSSGYPDQKQGQTFEHLYGPAERIFREKRSFERMRNVSAEEKGLHNAYSSALDYYFPIYDNDNLVRGFLLLTSYRSGHAESAVHRMIDGLVRQFTLAFYAQVTNEERRQQGLLMERLNTELEQEKYRLQEQRDLIQSIIESIHEGMMLSNDKGEVIFENQRLRDMFQIDWTLASNSSGFFQQLQALMGSDAMVFTQRLKAIFSGETTTMHERFSIIGADASKLFFDMYVKVIDSKEHEDRGYLFVFRDRTEEEAIDEMKNEFISIVSHELRTPLSSVLGFVEILLHRDPPIEKRKKYLDTIYKEGTRLSNLINDFLDLQRMESGKQTYHMVPLQPAVIVEQVVEQWQGKQPHKIVLYNEAPGVIVLADKDRVTQVLHNLLSNAIKYSPEADRVDVRVNQIEGKVQLSIQDYGLGIPEDATEKLFTKFFRVDNSDRRQIGGTGLGLSIVKEIVESHHGTLTFTSELGVGSTFTIVLDVYEYVAMDHRVVIVEDDPNIAGMISDSFHSMGISTALFVSAEEASFALKHAQQRPLLCIVDIMLDGALSGWDFVSELARHPQHHMTPVIISSVMEPPINYHESDKEKFLQKPFTIERLMELSDQLIKAHGTEATYIFPGQSESAVARSVEKLGLAMGELKVKEDVIEVEVKPNERE